MDNLKYEDNLLIDEKNPIKKIIKRVIRKSVLFLFRPYIIFQNQINVQLAEQNALLEEQVAKQNALLEEQLAKQNALLEEQLVKQNALLEEKIESVRSEAKHNIGVIARQISLMKWQMIDKNLQEKNTDVLTCRICGHSQERGKYETKETDCIFYGGHLVRYVCPKCGVVFGPTKFLNQTKDEIDLDYQVHYLGFSEGDSTYKEIRIFFMLKPSKEGIYLNYGCGHWSASLQNLREQGYNVYGYEPYSPDIENPYMITSKEALSKMRFDGIYSNDLLEHLLDPVKELKFMKSLLLNAESGMAHCTACYVYKYEYTRFHVHFFMGESVKTMCDKSGLEITDFCNDLEEHDFIGYVFSPVSTIDNVLNEEKKRYC